MAHARGHLLMILIIYNILVVQDGQELERDIIKYYTHQKMERVR